MDECTCYGGVENITNSMDVPDEMRPAYVMIAAISARCERHIAELSKAIASDETGRQATNLFSAMETHGCTLSKLIGIHDDQCLNSVIDDTMTGHDPVIGRMLREIDHASDADTHIERFAEFMRDGSITRIRYVEAAVAGWQAAWETFREVMSGHLAKVVVGGGSTEPDFDACHCDEIIAANFSEDDRTGPSRPAYVMAAAMISDCVLHVDGVSDVLVEDESGTLLATMWTVISGHLAGRDEQLSQFMGGNSSKRYTDLFAAIALAARDSDVMRQFDAHMDATDGDDLIGFFAASDAYERDRFVSIVADGVQYVERAHALLSSVVEE